MSLSDLLTNKPKEEHTFEVTEELLDKNLDALRRTIAYWRMYPDRFIDFLCSINPNNGFKFYPYQRILLRAIMRHRYVFITLTRGASKSFTVIMAMIIRAVLYPNSSQFIVSGVKAQSAAIIQEKVNLIMTLVPALSDEIIWDTRGTNARTRQTKDTVIYTFRNGSIIQNVVAGEQTRGLRFQSGCMEECINLDQDVLQQVIIPTMNVDRNVYGAVDPNEPANKQQTYITTAGFKSSASYENMVQILCQSIINPKKAIVIGGDWKIPVSEGLLNKDFVKELKANGSFNEDTFSREYGSTWIGEVEDAFFSPDKFDRQRKLRLAETKYDNELMGRDHYVMGVDVGRFGCTTEVVIIKVSFKHKNEAASVKSVVNIMTFDEENFVIQALKIKKLFRAFKCRACVVDSNGMGTGLVDLLVLDQTDPDTGEIYYNMGVMNDPDDHYTKFRTPNTIRNAIYCMKATQSINSELYAYTQAQLMGGRLKFLITEQEAKDKLENMDRSKRMTAYQKEEYLRPYVMTSILREQLMNLVLNRDGAHLVLKQSNPRIRKDKFSALIYALSICKMDEDRNVLRCNMGSSIGDMMLYTKGAGDYWA